MNLKNRIKKLENRNGFKNEMERLEYIRYARLIDPDIVPADILTPADYLKLLDEHLDPLPEPE